MPDGERFVPLEQVIAAHLDQLFPGMVVEEHFAFRVTRNADLTLEEEEADDLLAAVEIELRRRRFGRAVRLEIDADVTDEVRDAARCASSTSTRTTCTRSVGPLDLGGLWALHDLDRPDLKDEPWVAGHPAAARRPRTTSRSTSSRRIRERDVLVHHPYDSFATSVEEFIRQAARDPQVLAIKLTLYRTSGDSPIITVADPGGRAGQAGGGAGRAEGPLRRGGEHRAGRERWKRPGVHVTYGLVGLKTHTKTALVVRDEADGIRRYCHIGTGNYNPKTAKLYEDIGLLTADADIGADLTQLFNFLTGYGRNVRYRKLLVAPATRSASASNDSSAARWRRPPGPGGSP